MALDLKLPELGENIDSADVLNVLVKNGDKIEKDIKRQKDLEGLNIKVLRFKDFDVKNNMDGVLDAIYKWVDNFAYRV